MLKNTKFLFVQSNMLFAGTVFAWTTIVVDFVRFYNTEGTLLKIVDCVYPNPVTTACFYGAIAFLVAFIWSLRLIKQDVKKLKVQQKLLVWFLVAGTVFAFYNFGGQLIEFYGSSGEKTSCSGVPTDNPFLTACFYGSLLFFLSLLSSIVAFFSVKKNDSYNKEE